MVKEEFYNLLKECGFKGLRHFARESGVRVGNIYSNISGRYKLSIERAFIFANTLGVPVDVVLGIFHADEMEKNRKAIEEKHLL